MKILWISLLLITGLKCPPASSEIFLPIVKEKINGVSFVASRDDVQQYHVTPVVNVNANYAAVMPFGFIEDLNSPEVIFNSDRHWYGETLEGSTQYIAKLQSHHINVMLKPQLWIGHGSFTGDIHFESEEEWVLFETSYRDFILSFAAVAETRQIPIYCIGTELEKFVIARPEFWNTLIKDVKAVYSGKLTYAANWDEYTRAPFWEDIDYIGVDAYFPISDDKDVNKKEVKEKWHKWIKELEHTAISVQKPILFTEYGYRSCDYAGKEPWRSDHLRDSVNLENQVVLLEALYEEVWDKDWMAGGFIWKWFIDYDNVGGQNNSMFTPQNKPAESVIKEHNAKYK